MLSYPQPVVPSLPRRCLSYTDLPTGSWGQCSDAQEAYKYHSSSDCDSECDNPQPIKRSRSDQSLTTTAQLAAAAAGREGSSSSAVLNAPYAVNSVQQPHGGIACAANGSAGAYVPSFTRAQRAPSLPVVLSDVGSSTNSLLSLDSDVTKSASEQHLNVLASHAAVGQREHALLVTQGLLGRSAGSSATDAITAAVGQAPAPAPTPLQRATTKQHNSTGVLCTMNTVSSAASLTQAQLWARGYDLTRSTSDASVSSGGYSAALQQLGLPLMAYSPPPLLSLDLPQTLSGSANPGASAAMDSLHSASDVLGLSGDTPGVFQPGLSIQQQKLASFQCPPMPATSGPPNVVVTAALGSSSWGMRAVNSRDSLHSSDSITSVEAGERLAGVRFGLYPRPAHGHTPSPHLKQAGSLGPNHLPPLSPAQPAATPGGLGGQRSASVGNLPGAAALAAGRAASGLGRSVGGVVSPSLGSARSWGGSNMASPGLQSEPSEALSAVPGASPAIELQSMGSVLGGDGQWLFAELSTGAIGALSPAAGIVLQQEERQQQQDQVERGLHASAALEQQPVISSAVPPVPASMALPVCSNAAATCSLPIMPAASGAFGFGFGASQANAAAAAAAAAAKLCLFEGSSFAHGGSAQATGGIPASAAQPRPSAFSASAGGINVGMSAPLPQLTSLPPRASLSCTLGPDGAVLPEQRHKASQLDASEWTFARRHASLDYARTSLSSRRRGSLELNMPWRKTLDAAIAKAAAESGKEAADSQRGSNTGSARGADGGSTASSRDTDADTAAEISVSEAEATFGSGAVACWQRPGAASQLDLLMPLPEGDDESLPSPCLCGPGSIGPGSMISNGRGSYDADVSSPASSRSARTSSSGGSVAADHDLPGSTNVGGYIGGSDSLGLARHSLDSPRRAARKQQQEQQHTSYGLEVDGAVMMEAVGTAGSTPLERSGSDASSLDDMHDLSVPAVVLSGQLGDASAASAAADIMSAASGTLAQQLQPLAGKRAAPEPSAKAAAAAAAGVGTGSFVSAPASALGLDGPMSELQSFPSASSISSRDSLAFYNRRGASNGASRDLELFVRLNRVRQTLDFAKRQAQDFAELDKAELTVWEALELMDGLREFEAGLLHAAASTGSGSGEDAQLTPDMSLKEHAFQVAELCRMSFPDKPWMALVGLLHGLGKLLAHPMWGRQPQWAVAGESFPVGCKFAPQISASEFFSANPDRRRRTYSTSLGVYSEACGLRNVYMSWGAPEYLYMLLVLNQTELPEEALFMIRYQRCYALTRPGGAYRQLMTAEDKALLPMLATFQTLLQYKRAQHVPGMLQGQQLYDYYNGLIATYLGEEALFW